MGVSHNEGVMVVQEGRRALLKWRRDQTQYVHAYSNTVHTYVCMYKVHSVLVYWVYFVFLFGIFSHPRPFLTHMYTCAVCTGM